MFTIDTIVRQQVNLFNGASTKYEEFEDRRTYVTYLAVYVIDANNNKFIVVIPYNGATPYTKKYR